MALSTIVMFVVAWAGMIGSFFIGRWYEREADADLCADDLDKWAKKHVARMREGR